MKTLGPKFNFLGIERKYSDYSVSHVVVLPAPYEHTVSYGGGTRFGPGAIINASHYVEFFDEELKREFYNEHGIATLPPLNFKGKKDKCALDLIERTVRRLMNDGKFVVTLGGEHTISTATIKAHLEKYPDLSVLHIDAHSDLRTEYEGNKYSHASVMARVCEFLDPRRLVQVGIRAQCAEEAKFIVDKHVQTFYAHDIREGKFDLPSACIPLPLDKLGASSVTSADRPADWQDTVVRRLTDKVYISFDVDGFDPSIMPATGTPEPDGLNWHETMVLLRKAGEHSKIVGFDVVEFAPIKGLHHADETSAKLITKILNYAM
jgi:agmatinase